MKNTGRDIFLLLGTLLTFGLAVRADKKIINWLKIRNCKKENENFIEEEKKIREDMSEEELDMIIADSFPASDPACH